MLLNIADIQVGKRLRGLRESAVCELIESIAKLGLQTPISVASGIAKREGDADGVSFTLIAGQHRLEACRRLGLIEIEARIVELSQAECELWEIDENLCRADLSELERGEHLARRKVVYETLYPTSKAGVAQATGMNRAVGNVAADSAATFTADAAARIGAAERTIRQSIRRVERIDPKIRDRIRDNPEIADSGVELDALADLAPEQQRKAVALIETGQAVGVRDAKKLMEPKKAAPLFKPQMAADEKWWQQFVSLMSKASEANRQRAREHLDDPVADNSTALRVVR